jgi:hypothetical protein
MRGPQCPTSIGTTTTFLNGTRDAFCLLTARTGSCSILTSLPERLRIPAASSTRCKAFVDEKLLRVPRQQWMEAFEYRGPGSTFRRAKVIQTIYDSSAPVPGPAFDALSEQFLRTLRVLAHDAIGEGGGELVSDVLAPATPALAATRRAS